MAIKLENYDKGIEELIKIVNTLEKEQLSLEKSIELYKKGMKLHKELVDILEKEEGRLFLFDEKAQDEEEKFVEKTLEDGQVSLEL
ncbi:MULTISPECIES: exodeoxyribonuclease VII small subunit [Parvimonas]|jgi:exonuclease VII small subunit|uniref:Exodeoxyribonuclease 7 small subunit n=1 Tax=Parvimonas micra TaxID=33033 RepID=A0A0B4S225_9FIRM|nr:MULTISPECIES: exodeoxyribonuclease VII small subunit [Parvimonas]AIZ36887.1 exodeoxyribonuclease VII small subunit [Parvimonas micra]AXU10727.1 exodeoxyribonuclease VII small subunit [Parvimonas micra]MBF1276217.1 exodeoxyribonuclease VII small subunit [Parvimonas micra]MBF1295172.1 exodeoxyribonuclease VII small subunit [Parvimonas sp.]MCZ7407171.1 exodeoxyribonuclease VII small subunit [Parvimonas micra]